MLKKKCKILSQFKTPLPLNNAVGIKFIFPYQDGRDLEKSVVTILDAEKGLVEFTLSDFEMQGLKVGEGQAFKCEVQFIDHKQLVVFAKGMNIVLNDERKVWV